LSEVLIHYNANSFVLGFKAKLLISIERACLMFPLFVGWRLLPKYAMLCLSHKIPFHPLLNPLQALACQTWFAGKSTIWFDDCPFHVGLPRLPWAFFFATTQGCIGPEEVHGFAGFLSMVGTDILLALLINVATGELCKAFAFQIAKFWNFKAWTLAIS